MDEPSTQDLGASASLNAQDCDQQFANAVSNPGSSKHPLGCKPCNKYNPDRWNEGKNDSCKHGDKCEFCHELHDRPKHRGQRGRHALQRRQYLEDVQKGEVSDERKRLVDEIYRMPHAICDHIKQELHKEDELKREDQLRQVLKIIGIVGERAQAERPDSTRLRGARGPEMSTKLDVAEIDGRIKWLVGTLHLMMRKMYDAKQSDEDAKSVVSKILQDFETDIRDVFRKTYRELPEGLELPDGRVLPKPPPPPQHWYDLAAETIRMEPEYAWLQELLAGLLDRAREDQDLDGNLFLEELANGIRECTLLPGDMEAVKRNQLLQCRDVKSLAETAIRIREESLTLLFEADDLEYLAQSTPASSIDPVHGK